MSTDDTTERSTESERSCGSSDAAGDGAVDTESGSSCGASTPTTETKERSSACGGSASSGSSCGSSTESTETKVGSTVDDFEAEPGRLVAVGLGPGQPG
jgi:precorrin-3B C17-methyltransferase